MSGGDVLAERKNYEKEEDDQHKNKVIVEAPQT